MACTAVEVLWSGDLAQCLEEALSRTGAEDLRRALGAERGGRSAAQQVVERVLAAPRYPAR